MTIIKELFDSKLTIYIYLDLQSKPHNYTLIITCFSENVFFQLFDTLTELKNFDFPDVLISMNKRVFLMYYFY